MHDPLIGALLAGTYRVGRLLGRGGMGAVYEARHEGLARIVALKVLAPEIASQPASLARFQREAMAAAQLGHPNIIGVSDFRTAPGQPAFMVMEYLQGRGLDDIIAQFGALEPSRVARLAYQTLDALVAAHQAGIVHRDIKPANLFVTQAPNGLETVKVLDFGVAKSAGSHGLTQAGTLVGSPLYMAPEQAFSDSIDGRADLYSVGATMYHALTGRVPLEADLLPRLLTILREQVPPPVRELAPHVDPQLAQVVDRALAKDPQARFPSAAAMRDALGGMGPNSGPYVLSQTGAQAGPSSLAALSQGARVPPSTVGAPHAQLLQHASIVAPEATKVSAAPTRPRARRWPWLLAVLLLPAGIAAGFHWKVATDSRLAENGSGAAHDAAAASPSALPTTLADAAAATTAATAAALPMPTNTAAADEALPLPATPLFASSLERVTCTARHLARYASSAADVQRTVTAHARELTACGDLAVQRANAKPAANVEQYWLEVDASGGVQQVRKALPLPARVPRPELDVCMGNLLRNWRFPKLANGTAEVQLDCEFVPAR